MEVIDPRTGDTFRLRFEFDQAYSREAYGPDIHCRHEITEPRLFENAGGGTALYRQCLTCGTRLGQAAKRNGTPQLADLSIAERYDLAATQRRTSLLIKYIDLQTKADNEWRASYEAYLQSPQWMQRRDLVIKRCSNVCEGCGLAPVADVHHLTYDHVQEEFLFELVGLCRTCHKRIHPKE